MSLEPISREDFDKYFYPTTRQHFAVLCVGEKFKIDGCKETYLVIRCQDGHRGVVAIDGIECGRVGDISELAMLDEASVLITGDSNEII